jgi:ADP-heptose:LPS heptosyltransferase
VTNTLRAVGVRHINLQSPFSSDLVAAHQADRYFEAMGMECGEQGSTQTLILPTKLEKRGQEILRAWNWSGESPLVLIHPGSGSAHKCVEAWRLATVIEWLIEADMTPMLLEGPADRQRVEQVLSSLTTPVPVIRELNLSVVAGVLSKAALYLGHDSGITHLAAALAIPTVACFGPTQTSRWGPLGPTVSVLSGMPCTCSNWSEVETCHEQACLQIPPDRMIEACRTQLMRRS